MTEDQIQHAKKYWQYEYDVASRYMVPLLRTWGVTLSGASVLDIGCGEGGGLCALHDEGAGCHGFDIDQYRVQLARELMGARPVDFGMGSLYDPVPPLSDRQYDLVVLHDVFEHLDHKAETLQKLKRYMKPTGVMLLTFPPYYSAYGAHQQHLRTWFARLPFFHLLPGSLSLILPRLRGEYQHIVEEVSKLGKLRMGMSSFERLAAGGELAILHRRTYLVSPNHIRFGLRPVPAGPLGLIPGVREMVCSGVVYLLSQHR